MYINILIIIIFYLKKVGSRCFDPQFQKWVAVWAGVHFFTSKKMVHRILIKIIYTEYHLLQAYQFIDFYIKKEKKMSDLSTAL
jgi:hypothetical protein